MSSTLKCIPNRREIQCAYFIQIQNRKGEEDEYRGLWSVSNNIFIGIHPIEKGNQKLFTAAKVYSPTVFLIYCLCMLV